MNVCLQACAQPLLRPEGGVRTPATEVKDGCKLPCRRRELNLCPLKEQPMLLMPESFLRPLCLKQITITDLHFLQL